MIDIIGKNASIETYPHHMFDDRHTLGLNHAAYIYQTTRAFSCYPFLIEDFLNLHKFAADKVVGIKFIPATTPYPRSEKRKPNQVEGLQNYIGYDRTKWLEPETVKAAVEQAKLGNYTYGYRARDTCLHLAIFWAICYGEKVINLFGCNHTPPTIGGMTPDDAGVDFIAAGKNRVKATRALVHEANKQGIHIMWWKNYEEYLKGVLYYGDCD